MNSTTNTTSTDADTRHTYVLCSKCNKYFKVSISEELIAQVEKYPFPIVLMHITHDGTRTVHTLVAYIDKDLNCRHVEYLIGKKVFITPFIMYNPNLLFVNCNRDISE